MVTELLRRAKRRYEEGGVRKLAHNSRMFLQTESVKALQSPNDGIYVPEQPWDNLILIDACPAWIFEQVYDGAGNVERKTSRGETTARFFRENFEGRSNLDTVLVSGNAAIGGLVGDLEFFKFVGLWGRENFPDFDRRFRDVVPPEVVVEKAVEMHERYPNKRLIAHFLQPHPPFVLKDGELLEKGSEYRDFTAARKGNVSRDTVVEIYRENTEYVLGYVEELADELDGKSVITSDHGTLLGEGIPLIYQIIHPRWRFLDRNRFRYAHYAHLRLPELVEVPWVELDYENRRRIEAAESPEGVAMNRDVIDQKLEALGYRA